MKIGDYNGDNFESWVRVGFQYSVVNKESGKVWSYRDLCELIRFIVIYNDKIEDLDALLDYLETECRGAVSIPDE